ncbi:hypothetical protein GE09DRAFT_376159 [Coniochaeta sp. 2T2.1]|nr:hypothetical protein GE09DRAFT_376159 [Coniochaeta sp. 2T2.1]
MPPVLRRIPGLDTLLSVLHHSSPPTQPSSPPRPLSLRFASASAPDDSPFTPTRTSAISALLGEFGTRVLPRQNAAHTTSTVPAVYGNPTSTTPGEVVGITLGSVAGFILLLWLIYTCLNAGNPDAFTDAESTVMSVGTASVGTRTRVRKHRHHRSPRRETVEIRTSGRGGPVIVEERGGSRVREVIVEDTTTTRRSASRARPPPRVVDEDEEIVVLEEHSPPRRHKSRRRSSAERRSGGYRVVQEDDVIVREVRRSSGSRRR